MHGFDARKPQALRSADRAGAGRDDDHDADGFSQDVSGDGRSDLRTGVVRMDRVLSETLGAKPDSGALFRRREHPSWGGAADGRLVREIGGTGRSSGPGFARPVPPGGYAWWYVDGISDDGHHGITLIAFIGSVFSPYYLKSGRGDPQDHCALNVALYGRRGHWWAMTERGRRRVEREEAVFSIGPSGVSWHGTALVFRIDERTVPLHWRIKGEVKLYPAALTGREFRLDRSGRHRWWPAAPCARIEVSLERPSLRWSGNGYFDVNHGDEALEDGFAHWNWARVTLDGGRRAALLYDVIDRKNGQSSLALEADHHGRIAEVEPPSPVKLPRTLWQIGRATRADPDGRARVVSTLEDTPFYTRSLISTRLLGQTAPAMHETLSLDRFRTRWVQALLPYRMPRRV